VFLGNKVLFYHHNGDKTIFDTTVAQQGLESVKDQLYNPLRQLMWGGSFSGENFIRGHDYDNTYVNTDYTAWTLDSKSPAREQKLQLCLYNAQVDSFRTWQHSLDSLEKQVALDKKAFEKNQQWWKQFWNRSFILIDENKSNLPSWEVGRNYQLFR